jgi:hypothetical protein
MNRVITCHSQSSQESIKSHEIYAGGVEHKFNEIKKSERTAAWTP